MEKKHIMITENKLFKKCLGVFCLFGGCFVVLILGNSILRGDRIEAENGPIHNYWTPTIEDIAYQDSMYQIIKNTQSDITDIKQDIVHILERLDYEDGSWDSIRYVKGGAIDKRRNKQ